MSKAKGTKVPGASRHTPAPWKWENKWRKDSWSSFYDGCMGCLGEGILWFGMDGEEGIYCNNETDARLIVAAPELLEALQALKPFLEDNYKNTKGYAKERAVYKQAFAAIIKVEGKEE